MNLRTACRALRHAGIDCRPDPSDEPGQLDDRILFPNRPDYDVQVGDGYGGLVESGEDDEGPYWRRHEVCETESELVARCRQLGIR